MVSPSSALGSKSSLTDSERADPKGFSFLRHASPVITAVLVDAAFFIKRARHIYGSLEPNAAAARLHGLALDHLSDGNKSHRVARLYRIFVYDAPPASWKGHTPIEKTPVDMARSATADWRNAFHSALRGKRKVALRLGEVPTNHVHWQLLPQTIKSLASGKRQWADISDGDFSLSFRQKGVDMRLGLDIASLSYKQQVSQIVLVSGDADFVPAAKLARREGIDFVLDPMWATIRPDLHEHVDGLRSVCPRPATAQGQAI